MIVLRQLSLITSIAILSLSAVLVTEAQTETATTSATQATTTASSTAAGFPESANDQDTYSASEVRQGTRVSLQNRTQERITKLAANINNRFDATIGRFSHIMTRLETRIAKLEATGTDTAAATAELQGAQDSLAKAKELMLDIDTFVYEAVSSESPRMAWPTVQTSLRTVQGELVATHTKLRSVIAALKAASQQTGDEQIAPSPNDGESNGTGTTTAEEITNQ